MQTYHNEFKESHFCPNISQIVLHMIKVKTLPSNLTQASYIMSKFYHNKCTPNPGYCCPGCPTKYGGFFIVKFGHM